MGILEKAAISQISQLDIRQDVTEEILNDRLFTSIGNSYSTLYDTLQSNAFRGWMTMLKSQNAVLSAVKAYLSSNIGNLDVTFRLCTGNNYSTDIIATKTIKKINKNEEWLTFYFDTPIDMSLYPILYAFVYVPYGSAISTNKNTEPNTDIVYADGSNNIGGYITVLSSGSISTLTTNYFSNIQLFKNNIETDGNVIDTIFPTKLYTYQDSDTLINTPPLSMYLDRVLNGYQDVRFSNGLDRMVFMPSNATVLASDVVTANVTVTLKGSGYADKSATVQNVKVKSSVGASKDVVFLQIGDSLTGGYASSYNITAPYISWARMGSILKAFCNSFSAIGNDDTETYDGTTYKAEGHGGWSLANHLYDSSVEGTTNPFYDVAVTWTDPALTAAGVKFSLAKYLTDLSLATPTHVVIQLGANDTAGATYIANMELIIKAIHEQYPNIFIGISLPGDYGTWFPEYYQDYALNNYATHNSTLNAKLRAWIPSLMELEDAANKVYFLPTYFVTPTGESIPTVTVDGKEISAYAESGYHPNGKGHREWAKLQAAWVLYTLTL